MQVKKPFGPTVAKTKIPDEIINQLNKYVDEIVTDKEKSKIQNHGHNLIGDVTQEIKLSEEILASSGWGNFLAARIRELIDHEYKKKIKSIKISSWVVRQFQHEYNPTHWHNGHVSGAGFLKVPSSFGEYVQDKSTKINFAGKLQLIHGSKQFLAPSTLNIKPEVGDFYLFPNYLMHTVFPYRDNNEERRSVSFNSTIDEDVFDIYTARS
mgnify:FL=1